MTIFTLGLVGRSEFRLAERYTLLAALCWQREREIAHHVGVRAEEKVNAELMKYVKKVMGKAKLLYKLAKAVTAQPEGVVREVIYPVVSEENARGRHS